MSVEYVLSHVYFVYERAWLSYPLLLVTAVFVFVLWVSEKSKLVLLIALLLLCIQVVLAFFHHHLLVPSINKHYGRLAIAEVVSSKSRNIMGNYLEFVSASYEAGNADTQTLDYILWDRLSSRGVYPVSKKMSVIHGVQYLAPSRVGQSFIIKYLPSLPSAFIFMAELSATDRQKICPVIQEKLSQLEQEQTVLREKEQLLLQAVNAGLSDVERAALQRKIRRGSDLTAEEQQYKDLSEETSLLGTRISSYRDLLEGDDYCQE
ncbi:hypothetical protein [Pelistega sp. MC2]|uniref:hypothetical protein n=1 Tax=Pelistega sp. MC2 TaxID=1720297 RepID=UPI0008DA8D3D|nr:hypothetical protein [Pelistega sp. MC2]